MVHALDCSQCSRLLGVIIKTRDTRSQTRKQNIAILQSLIRQLRRPKSAHVSQHLPHSSKHEFIQRDSCSSTGTSVRSCFRRGESVHRLHDRCSAPLPTCTVHCKCAHPSHHLSHCSANIVCLFGLNDRNTCSMPIISVSVARTHGQPKHMAVRVHSKVMAYAMRELCSGIRVIVVSDAHSKYVDNFEQYRTNFGNTCCFLCVHDLRPM